MAGPRRLSPKKMQIACDRFNAKHSVGDTIGVWPGAIGMGTLHVVRIVEPGAHVLSGHTAVVQVSGGHGCIALTHVVDMRGAEKW
ncbi:hypothetical protein OCOJLMKI_0071 [Methylobacterium iners]|uniref:Uncharacterized protein n=2 Tax=Methylobacterium iners TaxID=418707 RepID=A0ABQ4RQ53_9HYPH|nr:hypothetical protein OCOJLMKI_0071 [Methylobacterium iners]